MEQRGVNLVLKLNTGAPAAAAPAENADPFAPAASGAAQGGVPPISALSARFINLYDALKLVCDVTGMKFKIRGNIVMIVPANEPDSELMTRPTTGTSHDRAHTAAASEMGPKRRRHTFHADGGQGQKRTGSLLRADGREVPDGSSISYLATIVTARHNTAEHPLAVFEQVLEDLNVTPRLIERGAFVEYAQEDSTHIGFDAAQQRFQLRRRRFPRQLRSTCVSQQQAVHSPMQGRPSSADGTTPLMGYAPYTRPASKTGQTGYYWDGASQIPAAVGAGQYGLVNAASHNANMNAIDGVNYSTGQRYLSTEGNKIAGEGNKINDNFMRVNAFLGNADLS
jgi:hypothetical protein